jgi:hypothetical protein
MVNYQNFYLATLALNSHKKELSDCPVHAMKFAVSFFSEIDLIVKSNSVNLCMKISKSIRFNIHYKNSSTQHFFRLMVHTNATNSSFFNLI